MVKCFFSVVIWITAVLLMISQPALGQTSTNESFTESLSFGIAIPLTGSPSLLWSRPISDRLVLGSEFAYFDRDWVFILEPSDWHSRSGYIGTFLQYYPVTAGKYTGYWIGIDGGLAISYQTYKPLNKSDIFFFPYIDLYFCGYTFKLSQSLYLDIWAGGGWAPVSTEVNIEGHTHDSGDWYPIADVRLTYRW